MPTLERTNGGRKGRGKFKGRHMKERKTGERRGRNKFEREEKGKSDSEKE